jgi:glycosyltransferase involved in cell wall biosynthesis
VTVVTPVRNGAKYLDQLICSVKAQIYGQIEHLVIDDGSDDDGQTVRILQSHKHLHWWTRENRGAYCTMNEGLRAAKGEIITFICADDLYQDRSAIRDVIDWWRRNSRYDVVCGGLATIDAGGKTLVRRNYYLRWPRSIIRYVHYLPHCCMFCDRKALARNDITFDVTLPYCADADWAQRIVAAGYRIGYISRIVSRSRMHKAQRSRAGNGRGMLKDMEEILRRTNGSFGVFMSIRRIQSIYQRLRTSLDDVRYGEYRRGLVRLRRGTYFTLESKEL